MDTPDAYEALRPLMFSIAYRMVATVSEAEDIVQEAFLRYHRALSENTVIDSPKAYLSAVTTRLCIDHLRSARVRRETYVGEWLPEPLVTDPSPADPEWFAEQADSLSMTFLLLLERLSPVERAVFLLRDVFDFGFDAIAEIVGKSESNCRQLAARARRHVSSHQPRFATSDEHSKRLAGQFFAAVSAGDLDGLVAMLADDVVVYGDSGGTRPSWPRPIVGRQSVGRLMVGLGRQMRQVGVVARPAEINGCPGAVVQDPDGNVISVFSLDIDVDHAGARITTIRSVINPDKLRHLGPLADRQRFLDLLRSGSR
jgi:RNA polymerase sigma-70 factor (ECF subfamily)